MKTSETKNQTKTENGKISYPLPPSDHMDHGREGREDMEVYARFMRHLRHVPSSRPEIKILSAIQFTADMLDLNDASVAKLLVDLGLRAPRVAFPADFLEFADQALLRSGWEVGSPNTALKDLQDHWDRIGEDKFAVLKRRYSLVDDRIHSNH